MQRQQPQDSSEPPLFVVHLADAWKITRGEADVVFGVVELAADRPETDIPFRDDLRRIAPGCSFYFFRLPVNSPGDMIARKLAELSVLADIVACSHHITNMAAPFFSLLNALLSRWSSDKDRPSLFCFELEENAPRPVGQPISLLVDSFQNETASVFGATLYPAGIAALILSANPSLPPREVQTILLLCREEFEFEETFPEQGEPQTQVVTQAAERWNAAAAVREAIRRRT